MNSSAFMETTVTKADLAGKLAKLNIPGITPRNEDTSDTEMVILPDPVGHHMLVALPTIEQQTKAGIIIPDTVSERERAATVVGTVLAQGSACYKDPKRFPDGAWCKVGDTVMFSRYQGMRFRSCDIATGEMVEYRMLSDDGIVGTVPIGAVVAGL